MSRTFTETLWCEYRVNPIGAKKVEGFKAVGFIPKPCPGCTNPTIESQKSRGVRISGDQKSVLVCLPLLMMSIAEQSVASRVIKPVEEETIKDRLRRHMNLKPNPPNLDLS